MINYSIIIPHYNIPDLLIRCVRSIPERNDVEIIVVDDNSPGGEKYKEMYPDLRRKGLTYIHLAKNVGGGGARNVGLEHAKGKWLLFADADDFFNYCLNDVLDEYVDNPNDIVFFNANSIDTSTYVNTGRFVPQNKEITAFLSKSNNDIEYQLRYSLGVPWCKLTKHELVKQNKIVFEETPIHNDTQFSYLIGYYAKTIDADIRAIYCLTDREGSVSRVLDAEKYLTRLKVFSKKYTFLTNKGIDFKDWWFIRSSIEYFSKTNAQDFLDKSKSILEESGISLLDVLASINLINKKNRRRRFKNKIIDRANIELRKILCIKD